MEGLLAATHDVLAAAWGRPVRLGEVSLLKSRARNDVLRAHVAETMPGLPASVVIKRFKEQPERGLAEWASLQFLSDLGLDPPLAPRFVGGDVRARVLLLEDLGEGTTLETFLQGHDPGVAEEALVRVARLVARMHATSRGRAADYERLRGRLAPRRDTTLGEAAAAFRRGRGAVEHWLYATRAQPWQGFARDYEAVARGIEPPGPFLAFTHGDLTPSNVLFTGAGVRLLDFEYGGARSALYDTLFWTLYCPFPAALIARVDEGYRRELMAACPAAAEDAAYRRERSQVMAWRTLSLLQWLSPALLEADREWAPGMTARQAVLWHLDRTLEVMERVETLQDITGTLERLAGRLGPRWAAEMDRMFVWPAFHALKRGASGESNRPGMNPGPTPDVIRM